MVGGEREALEAYTDPDLDHRRAMVVEADQGLGEPGAVVSRGEGVATVVADPPAVNGAVFTVESEGEGWLVMADTFGEGWAATVDGESVPVMRVDYALRAVEVPAGRSRVELRYRPPGFTAGAWWSGLTGLVLLATGSVALVEGLRRSRRQASSPGIR
ncbi:MAG: YfhO family protein [Acidimicrobiia bacterium]|nr:YfhO family protein [Acidimicrobiia bacterium]